MMPPETYLQVERACLTAWTPSIRRQARRLGLSPEQTDAALREAARIGADRVEDLVAELGLSSAEGFSLTIDREAVTVEGE